MPKPKCSDEITSKQSAGAGEDAGHRAEENWLALNQH